uniref:Uncharacterized protein n=1 Tax=Arundo donax TaxID=35708 RepID=A0A0A9EBG6_ARUDO
MPAITLRFNACHPFPFLTSSAPPLLPLVPELQRHCRSRAAPPPPAPAPAPCPFLPPLPSHAQSLAHHPSPAAGKLQAWIFVWCHPLWPGSGSSAVTRRAVAFGPCCGHIACRCAACVKKMREKFGISSLQSSPLMCPRQ